MRSLNTPRNRRVGLWLSMAALTLAPASLARGQSVDRNADRPIALQEPAAFRVYQRGQDGRAEIEVKLAPGIEDARVVEARLSGQGVDGSVRFEEGKLVRVPVGGPYTVNASVQVGSSNLRSGVSVQNVFVGDLWVLAGQSNMQGVGDLVDVTPPNPHVMLLGMDGAWSEAREPLHWLVDSPDAVHSGDAKTRAERSAQEHRSRKKGAGLGLPFAVALTQATRVPVGLIATAHGGTSMAQWDPAKKGEGGNSLYASMLRSVNLAGGKVKGVLWYQGEAEAGGGRSKVYEKAFTDFIAAVRADLGDPDLPFYYVQIGRFIHAADPAEWNAVQDVQRRLPERVPNTAVVSVVDLELDDLIHVGTQGLKRAGHRLARIAQRELFGLAGATTPTLDRVNKGNGNTLVVKFKGVNLAPTDPSTPASTTDSSGFYVGGMTPASRAANSPMAPHSAARVVGLRPSLHIAGFSIRDEKGAEIPLIFEAAVGSARDTVVLKLIGPVPAKSFLWYGHGYDPYCNLTDGADMAVPVFGPVPLDDVR